MIEVTHLKRCECRVCKLGRRMAEIKSKLSKEDSDFLEDIYAALACAETDATYWKLKFTGEWDSTEEERKEALEALEAIEYYDEVGIYPQKVMGDSPGAYEKRTEFMEGWNACAMKQTELHDEAINKHQERVDAIRKVLLRGEES